MSKVRFQMFLDETQKMALEKLQKETGVPMAELVRKAIDKLISDFKKRKNLSIEDEATERLLAVGGICSGGPKDLADKHDKYLYG